MPLLCKRETCLLIILAIIGIFSHSDRAFSAHYSYCVPVQTINFNPFHEIADGKELAYQLLLRPYLSNDPKNPGILDASEFSPDGKVFSAHISPTALWPDGSKLTPSEAALGIAKGFLFRPIGKKVKVRGAQDLARKNTCVGIKILGSSNFELRFSSNIENLTGTVREALSSGSRHNRVWPVRFPGKNKTEHEFEVIGKFPIFHAASSIPEIHYGEDIILFANRDNCLNADYSLYPEALNSGLNLYSQRRSKSAQSISAIINTSRNDLKRRMLIASWIRNSFSVSTLPPGIESTPSFFLRGEPGFDESTNWNFLNQAELIEGSKLKIGYEIPVFRNDSRAICETLRHRCFV